MWEDYGITIMQDIENHKNLVDKQRKELEEKEMIVNSLTKTLAGKVRNVVIPYNEKMLNEAWSNKDGEMRKFINKDLKERLFVGGKAKLLSIAPLNYDRCVYYFYYEYKGYKFCLAIPNTKVANEKNLDNLSYGKYSMTYEAKPGFYKSIAKSYDLDDIAKAIEEFLAER